MEDEEIVQDVKPSYFWDTYAIIELLEGNLSYEEYSKEKIVITVFNLVEIYYYALREYSELEANEIYERYKHSVVKISDSVLKEATVFRRKYKSKDLSYADCIGYVYALKNKIKFLTGDKGFKGMKNVEFVK